MKCFYVYMERSFQHGSWVRNYHPPRMIKLSARVAAKRIICETQTLGQRLTIPPRLKHGWSRFERETKRDWFVSRRIGTRLYVFAQWLFTFDSFSAGTWMISPLWCKNADLTAGHGRSCSIFEGLSNRVPTRMAGWVIQYLLCFNYYLPLVQG